MLQSQSREDILQEGIENNVKEVEKWLQYKKDNEDTIENLEMFVKHLNLDVLVPLGSKALMPGKLIHTNEVLVSHYQDYFSKCSAHKAKEICKYRIQLAENQLKKLKIEEKYFENNLIKPYLEGAVPFGEQQEIIEEYDEEKEKHWRERHKVLIRNLKQQEINKNSNKDQKEIMENLEELELLQDLQNELESLECKNSVDTKTIRQIMNAEPAGYKKKVFIAHNEPHTTKNKSESSEKVIKDNAHLTATKIEPVKENNKNEAEPQPVIKEIIDSTNENNKNDTEPQPASNASTDSESEELDIEAEILELQETAANLKPADRKKFFELKINFLQEEFRQLPEEDKKHRKKLCSMISWTKLLSFDAYVSNDEEESDEIIEDGQEEGIIEQPTQKRRISFALEDQRMEFRENEAVSQMLPQRYVVQIDKSVVAPNKSDEITQVGDKKEKLFERVRKNNEFVSENQSQQDTDFLSKIISGIEDGGKEKTLYIKFRHSPQPGYISNANNGHLNVPGYPGDIYQMCMKKHESDEVIYLNAYPGEEVVITPIMREILRTDLFEDPKTEFSRPKAHVNQNRKSILRNKEAVANETHVLKCSNRYNMPNRFINQDVPKINTDVDYASAHNMIMRDVVERKPDQPDPLPKYKFIDAHAPKKRISRFKQERRDMKDNHS